MSQHAPSMRSFRNWRPPRWAIYHVEIKPRAEKDIAALPAAITRRIADAQTLAECLAAGKLDAELARETGALVARFHRAGIWHADLNAHNVLVTSSALHLIDFDRGRLRVLAEGWRLANLERLHRSLLKLGAAAQGEEAFRNTVWTPLLDAYEATFGA